MNRWEDHPHLPVLKVQKCHPSIPHRQGVNEALTEGHSSGITIVLWLQKLGLSPYVTGPLTAYVLRIWDPIIKETKLTNFFSNDNDKRMGTSKSEGKRSLKEIGEEEEEDDDEDISGGLGFVDEDKIKKKGRKGSGSGGGGRR
ncbi:unnamed protein product [Dovyalis caffra]|uniref:Uncharacterized protein n=1 Tax=Dovyalis caffra TaxID=77055 RepID=A0AAV1SGJ4_9ROSI|nr:unnamed protein product [Dovyalis caffra]